jgi:HEAT repeat protein
MAEALGKIFSQCHPAVKSEILRVVTRMRLTGADAVIEQGMADGDRRVKVSAVEMAGKLPAKGLVKKLLPLIAFQSRFGGQDEDDELQETTCRALGAIGDPTTIPALVEVGGAAPFMKRTKSEPVRCAAVLALGEFISDEGKRAVETFVKAKELAIRQAAEQAKRRQSTKTQKKGDRLAATVL